MDRPVRVQSGVRGSCEFKKALPTTGPLRISCSTLGPWREDKWNGHIVDMK